MKVSIHNAISDTVKDGLSIITVLTQQTAIDCLVADHKELVKQHGGQDEFFDAVANGECSSINQLNLDSTTFGLMDIITANIKVATGEEKPYLFTVCTVFGEYNVNKTYLSYTDDPDETAKELAFEERSSKEDDWCEKMEGYWFDGNFVKCHYYREITPAEAQVWLLAKQLEEGARL